MDEDAGFFQRLAIEHVLIAVVLETLVERMAQHDGTLHHEVGGVEMGVGGVRPPGATLLVEARHFVGLAKVVGGMAI